MVRTEVMSIEWIKWILIRIENWCVRLRMDFDSNRKLVPIGLYRFLLMVRTVRTEVMSCQPVDKVYKSVYPGCVLQFEMYFFLRTYIRTVYVIITYLALIFIRIENCACE